MFTCELRGGAVRGLYFIMYRLFYVAGLEARDARRRLRLDPAKRHDRLVRGDRRLVARRHGRVLAISAVANSGRFNHREEPCHDCGRRDQRVGIGTLSLSLSPCWEIHRIESEVGEKSRARK